MAMMLLVFMDMMVESNGRSHGCEAKGMCTIALLLICSGEHDVYNLLRTRYS
jgi:hypothetical protein